jgi:hypothetical protein
MKGRIMIRNVVPKLKMGFLFVTKSGPVFFGSQRFPQIKRGWHLPLRSTLPAGRIVSGNVLGLPEQGVWDLNLQCFHDDTSSSFSSVVNLDLLFRKPTARARLPSEL